MGPAPGRAGRNGLIRASGAAVISSGLAIPVAPSRGRLLRGRDYITGCPAMRYRGMRRSGQGFKLRSGRQRATGPGRTVTGLPPSCLYITLVASDPERRRRLVAVAVVPRGPRHALRWPPNMRMSAGFACRSAHELTLELRGAGWDRGPGTPSGLPDSSVPPYLCSCVNHWLPSSTDPFYSFHPPPFSLHSALTRPTRR